MQMAWKYNQVEGIVCLESRGKDEAGEIGVWVKQNIYSLI